MINLVIYGAGDLSLEVIWYIDQINALKPTYKVLGILDDYCTPGTPIGEYFVLGGKEYFELHQEPVGVVIAIASPTVSNSIFSSLSSYKFIFYPNIISPSSLVSPSAVLGQGCIIPPGVVINVNVNIGDFVKLGQGAMINHHCCVGNHSFVGPNSTLTGHVELGARCFVGAAATILPECKIVKDTMIGAGSTVTKSIEESGIYIGCPARIKEKKV